jgi:hypothetical protein
MGDQVLISPALFPLSPSAWRHGLFHMPMAPSARPRQFPLSFWLQVAVLSYTRDRLTLARLTKTIHTAVLPLLYRDIAVTQSAADVVNTLATKTFLLPAVRHIIVAATS